MKIKKALVIAALALCVQSASAQYNMPTQTFTYDKPYAVEKIATPKRQEA